MGTFGIYPLVMTNIAVENCLLIESFPIEHGDFPWLCKRLPEGGCDDMGMMNVACMPPNKYTL